MFVGGMDYQKVNENQEMGLITFTLGSCKECNDVHGFNMTLTCRVHVYMWTWGDGDSRGPV